jgi:hypothetical protein
MGQTLPHATVQSTLGPRSTPRIKHLEGLFGGGAANE